MTKEQHSAIVSKLTKLDRMQEKRDRKAGRAVNIYALGLQFQALERAEKHIAKGVDARLALLNSFNDRLLAHVLKAAELEPPTRDECKGWGFERLPQLDN